MLIKFLFLYFFIFIKTLIHSAEVLNKINYDSLNTQWEFIVGEAKKSNYLRCKNLLNVVPGAFLSHGDTKEYENRRKKTETFSENCISAIKSLLDLHLPKNKRRFTFKFPNINNVNELVRLFCNETAVKFFAQELNPKISIEKINLVKRKKAKDSNLILGELLQEKENSITLPNIHTTEKERKEMRIKDNIDKQSKIETNKSRKSIINRLDEIYDDFESEQLKKTPNIIIVLVKTALEEIKNQLPDASVVVANIPPHLQPKILRFMKAKDIESIVELLKHQPDYVVKSFLESLEVEVIRYKNNIPHNSITQKENENSYSNVEKEWSAIVDLMSDPSSPIQRDIKDGKLKGISLKIPIEFKFSNGLEKRFLQFCKRAMRLLAFDKYVADDGKTYFAYNEDNNFNIYIAGNDVDERKQNLQAFCYMAYNRIYGIYDKELQSKRENKIINIKKSWEEGGKDGQKYESLLIGFTNEMNDERLQWLYLVEAASSPNDILYCKELPRNSIPISFRQKSTDRAIEINDKIKIFTENCRNTLILLGVENNPGTKNPLYKMIFGGNKVNSIIKFCRSISESYMNRLLNWFNIVLASLTDEIIQLTNKEDPEYHCPFFYDNKKNLNSVETCYKTIIKMIEDNKISEKKGIGTPWINVKVHSPSQHVSKHVNSFCKSVVYDKPEIRDNAKKELDEELYLNNSVDISNSVDEVEDEAIEAIEYKMRQMDLFLAQKSTTNTYKLDIWSQKEDNIIENRLVRDKLDKYNRKFLERVVKIEEDFKNTIYSIINNDKSILNEEKYEKNRNQLFSLIDQYTSDSISMRTEWSELVYEITNNNRKLVEIEVDIIGFIKRALDYVSISHRVEIASSVMRSMINWETELKNKEFEYVKLKIQVYNAKIENENRIYDLKQIHLKRRLSFEHDLYRILPRKLWIYITPMGGKGLYPIMPLKISEKTLIDHKTTILKLKEEKRNLIEYFDSKIQKLSNQLMVLKKVIDKNLKELNNLWDNTYSIEYAIQWELRVKDLEETYIKFNQEYKQLTELISQQQLRQAQLRSNHPQYDEIMKESTDIIEISNQEIKNILNLMQYLREKRNDLDNVVENDMTKTYAVKVQDLHYTNILTEYQILNEIDASKKENSILLSQIDRDIKYYEIIDYKTALEERRNKFQGLKVANSWLFNKNEEITKDYENKLEENLNILTYIHKDFDIKNYNKNYDETTGLDESAILELNNFRHKLKILLSKISIYNKDILNLDLEDIQEFEKYDSNILITLEQFELDEGIDDGTLYNDLSISEWNLIQKRWKILKIKYYYLDKKEKLLLEGIEIREKLDRVMLQNYGYIPISKASTSVPSKAHQIVMKQIGIISEGTRIISSLDRDDKVLTYDEKVIILVQKRFEETNALFEKELTNRLIVLDEKIKEGRVELQHVAKEVVSNWEIQQTTASFRFASPQNKDRMRETFVKEHNKVTKEQLKVIRPLAMEKHILSQQQRDRVLEFKKIMEWLNEPNRTANQVMKFEEKFRVFEKIRQQHYEDALEFLLFQAEKLDQIKSLEDELNVDINKVNISSEQSVLDKIKKERDIVEAELGIKKKAYQEKLSNYEEMRELLYDPMKNLVDSDD